MRIEKVLYPSSPFGGLGVIVNFGSLIINHLTYIIGLNMCDLYVIFYVIKHISYMRCSYDRMGKTVAGVTPARVASSL